MASKKEKFLESAQRFMMKGQLDKAIKDYQQVVALEPKEIRYRQKLAELLVRDSRKEEAIAQYEGIARHYAESSHFLKAIAVYKQIQRLSPENTEIALTVASLNHKQGLIGNAFAEYGQVVSQFEKAGAIGEAIKVLEQMLVIDGEHAATRLRRAELLFTSGAEDASYEAFGNLLRSLKGRGDQVAAQQVADRMDQLFASRQQDDLEGVAARIQAGECDGAIHLLQERVKRDRDDLRAWQLLCEAERLKGNVAGLRQVYGQMMNLFADNLDVLEAGIRFHIEAADSRGALSLIELHLPRFIEKGKPLAAEGLLLSLSAEVAKDPKAVEALKRIYQAAGATDKLDALQQGARPSEFGPAKSLFSSSSAPEASTPSGSGELPAFLSDSMELPAPWEMESPASAVDAAPPAAAAPWEEEIQLDLDDDADPLTPSGGEIDLPQDFSLSLPSDMIEEVEEPAAFSEDLSPFGEISLDEGTPSPFGEPAPANAGGASYGEISFDEAPSPFDEEISLDEVPSPFGQEISLDATSSPFAEEFSLDEVPPPFEEELSLDEVPSSFEEELSLDDDSPFGGPAAKEQAPSPFEEEISFGDVPSSFGEAASPFTDASPAAEMAAAATAGAAAPLAGGDIDLEMVLPQGGGFPDIDWSGDEEPAGAGAEQVAEAAEIEAVAPVEEAAPGLELPEPPELIEEAEELELELDLYEEEDDEGDDLEAAAPARPLRGWQEIFPEACADGGTANDPSELESHYDLGVGYKEMGMYSQAIKEFAMAAGNPQRRLDCLTLQAVCFREKGEPEKAQDLLQRGRELEVLSDGERVTICYELGFHFESQGASREAVELYREVHHVDPTFHDVAERLSALTGEESLDFIELDPEAEF